MASPTGAEQQDPELQQIKKNLFKLAMQGKWEKVVQEYETNPKTHGAKITRSGDTALHIAVSDRKEAIVEQLVNLINDEVKRKKDEKREVEHPLTIANERGNTPLHLAASIGNVKMCKCIAQELKHQVVGIRNRDRETPFFLAALHGKKEVFLYLHQLCGAGTTEGYCRRSDGETILHCAISGEYFG